MRWPFGRVGRQAAAGAGERHRDMAPAVPQHSLRGWAWVPPLATTIALKPPILHEGLLRLPRVSGTRPLLRQPPSMIVALPIAQGAGADSRLRLGQRTGFRNLPAPPRQHAADSADQPRDHAQPHQARLSPARTASALSRPTDARRQLTRATDDYVGEPLASATPYQSSAWLRKVSSIKPPWAQEPEDEIHPLPPELAAHRTIRPGSDPRAQPAERASLARSRQLGLGPPSSRAAREVSAPSAGRSEQRGMPGPATPASGEDDEARTTGQAGDPALPRPEPDDPPQGRDGVRVTAVTVPAEPADRADAAAPTTSEVPSEEPGPATGQPMRPQESAAPSSQAVPGWRWPIASPGTRETSAKPEGTSEMLANPAGVGSDVPSQPGRGAAARPGRHLGLGPPLTRPPLTQPPLTQPPGGARPQRTAIAAPADALDEAPAAPLPEMGTSSESAAHPSPTVPLADEGPVVRLVPAGPVYRSVLDALPPLAPPDRRRLLPAGSGPPAVEVVPSEVARAFRSVHGFDVSNVRVHRGPAVADQARALGARAFTVAGEVYLPRQAGSVRQGGARALLAHELTHAAQQQLLASALPTENSPAGRALEAQANATERWFLGDPVVVPPLTHLQLPGAPSPDGVQRQSAGTATDAVVSQAPEAPEPGSAAAGSGPMPLSPEPGAPAQPPGGTQAWRDTTAASPAPAGPAEDLGPELAQLRQQVTELAQGPAAALSDPVALDDLAGKLYQRLRSKLRLELIVDRERAGLLADFR